MIRNLVGIGLREEEEGVKKERKGWKRWRGRKRKRRKRKKNREVE